MDLYLPRSVGSTLLQLQMLRQSVFSAGSMGKMLEGDSM